ncbi:peptidoglycan-binding protein [uncultured Cocleimonas sp.]|uniref:peptidoglycan-binding domain-containing protein n=1 Tax=uncultured Cocleimonas sp. TaxID=1051587 RepID=UPI0026228A58|nr:peptidoglycan-binding domain-containing protein [uncultured Cocleimonas sp.]
MFTKTFASAAVLALLLPATQTMAASHSDEEKNRIDATDTLPDAKPGECYAKVIVPAQYETKTEQVLVKPESEKVEVKPAVFDVAEKSIVAKEGFTKVKVIPAKFREEFEEVEVAKASTEWVTDLGKKGIPASPALLAAAKTNSIDISSAAIGECFKEFYVPAKYEQSEKEVLVKEESEEIKVAAAQFEETEETVVVKQASKKKVYKPAEYETIEEKIEIEPAKAVWKKGDGPITKIDNSTGEIMCLIQVPAKYKIIKKTVLKTPSTIDLVEIPEEAKGVKVSKLVSDATIDKVKIPAEYKKITLTNKVSDASFTWRGAAVDGEGTYTGNQICLKEIPAKFTKVKKLVIDTPAAIEEEKVEPVAKLIKVSNVATEAEEIRTMIPAEYNTVEKRAKVASERLEWRRVLCKTNMGPDINKRIQQALKDAGVYTGAVDGNVGRGTMSAVERFQKDNGLATGGLTIDTLEKLGVM